LLHNNFSLDCFSTLFSALTSLLMFLPCQWVCVGCLTSTLFPTWTPQFQHFPLVTFFFCILFFIPPIDPLELFYWATPHQKTPVPSPPTLFLSQTSLRTFRTVPELPKGALFQFFSTGVFLPHSQRLSILCVIVSAVGPTAFLCYLGIPLPDQVLPS